MTILTLARDLQTLNENEAQFEQLEKDWYKINSYLDTLGKKQGMQIEKRLNFKYSKRPTTLHLANVNKFLEMDKLSISSSNRTQYLDELHTNSERVYVVLNDGNNFICRIDIRKSGAKLQNIVNHIRNNSFPELLRGEIS